MKKLIGILTALLIAGSVFAVDFSIDAGFDIPMSVWKSEKFTYGSTTEQTTYFTNGIGFDIGAQAMFTKEVGVRFEFGYEMPKSQSDKTVVKTRNSKTNRKSSFSYPDVYSDFKCLSIFCGAALHAAGNKTAVLYVSPGVVINNYSGTSKVTGKTGKSIEFGLGADIEGRINITSNLYLKAGFPVYYMIVQKVNGQDADMIIDGFNFTPQIGLGYRF